MIIGASAWRMNRRVTNSLWVIENILYKVMPDKRNRLSRQKFVTDWIDEVLGGHKWIDISHGKYEEVDNMLTLKVKFSGDTVYVDVTIRLQ